MHSLYPGASVTIVCGACLHVAKGRVSNFFEFETASSEPSEPLASVSILQLVRTWTLSILPVLQSLLWGCSARDLKVLLLNPVPAGACALCNSTFSNAIGRHQYLRLPIASQISGCTGRPIGSCRWHCNRHLRIVQRSQHMLRADLHAHPWRKSASTWASDAWTGQVLSPVALQHWCLPSASRLHHTVTLHCSRSTGRHRVLWPEHFLPLLLRHLTPRRWNVPVPSQQSLCGRHLRLVWPRGHAVLR